MNKSGDFLDIEKFIIQWNIKYPFDRYIRKKYGISFGSEQHKQLNFINMVIEHKEDMIIKRELEAQEMREEEKLWGDILPIKKIQNGEEVVKVSKKVLDKDFEDLDLSKYN